MQSWRGMSLAWLGALFMGLAVSACTPTYPKCEKDDHCAEKSEVCVEGTCQQCRDNTQCEANQQCNGGRCEAKPECADNGDCSGNKICRSGKCQLECSAPGDCGSGLKCMANRCVDQNACNADTDCTAGMSCLSGTCQIQQASRSMCTFPAVQFEFNRARLSDDAKSGLREVVDCLKERGGTLIVEGHCDERGTEEYNLALGDRRARAVKEYLTRLGVSSSSLQVVSKGETQPTNDSSNEAAWQENRRAEFIQQ